MSRRDVGSTSEGHVMNVRRTCLCALVVVLTAVAAARAQAPAPAAAAGGEVYLVAYVEIEPSARTTMVAALRAYREASGREDGAGRVDVFEQVGRPAHFAVVERWRNQASLDLHLMAAHTRQFRDALQSIRLSGYDERPYRPLSVAAPSPSGGGAGRLAYVVTHVDIAGAAAQAEAPAMLRRLSEESRREPGNVRFDVLQHAMRANHFTVVESWRDQAALDAHAAAAHTRAYRDAVQPMSGSPIDERVYTAVE